MTMVFHSMVKRSRSVINGMALPGGGSTVYVLPLTGGEPKRYRQTPSYWHGWAPNGREVAIVGQRNGSTYL